MSDLNELTIDYGQGKGQESLDPEVVTDGGYAELVCVNFASPLVELSDEEFFQAAMESPTYDDWE